MRSTVSAIVLFFIVFPTHPLFAQYGDSSVDPISWRTVVDAGLFPAANRVGVGWYPVYSVRAGMGRGNSTLSAYVFLDYYSFGLSEPGGLHSYIPQTAKRYDIAVYPAIWISRILFLGAGAFNTHSDPVDITSIHGVDPWPGGGTRGWRWVGTIGLTWDFRLTSSTTVPLGIYYRNPGYHADNALLAVRAGINVRIK